MAIEQTLIDALGGHLNIVEVEPCTMRIRIQVKSQRDVDEAALRVDGVLAVVRSGNVVQIVCGAESDDVAAAMISISVRTPKLKSVLSPQRRRLFCGYSRTRI